MTARAMRIRSLFADADTAEGRRPWTTDEVMLGFVGDVGDLAKLVQGRAGVRPRVDLDEALGHELADCLWSLLVLAEEFEVDLGSAFTRLMDQLEHSVPAKVSGGG